MSMGDSLRGHLITAISNYEEAIRITELLRDKINEANADVMLIDAYGGSNSPHVHTANRIGGNLPSEILTVREAMMLVRAELAEYLRKLS